MINQFNDVIKGVIQNSLLNLNFCLPGQIETYDPKLKKVSVKPLLKKQLSGQEVVIPVIENVPVVFTSSKSSIVSTPLKQGDGCLLIFSQRSLDEWLSKGGDILPKDPRTFDLSDAICIPGLFPFNDPGRVPTGEALEIYNDNGNVEIQGNTDFAVRFSSLETSINSYATSSDTERTNIITAINAELTKIATAINAIVPGSYVPTPITTAPVSADISSSKVENVLLP